MTGSSDNKANGSKAAEIHKRSSSNKVDAGKAEELLKKFDHLLVNFPPTVLYMPMYYLINLFKAGTLPVMLFLMYYYQNFSTGAYLYTALHGAYGIAWILKHIFFADQIFNQSAPLGTHVVTVGVLVAYWMIGFLVMNGTGIQDPSPQRMFLSIVLVAAGSAIMISADAQKTFTLRLQKGLINNGWSARTRNPNYLAEMTIYSGFAVVSGVWISWAILFSIWGSLFLERMALKEFSYRKKEGWDKYKDRSNMLLPRIVPGNLILDWMVYGVIIFGLVMLCNQGGLTGLLSHKSS